MCCFSIVRHCGPIVAGPKTTGHARMRQHILQISGQGMTSGCWGREELSRLAGLCVILIFEPSLSGELSGLHDSVILIVVWMKRNFPRIFEFLDFPCRGMKPLPHVHSCCKQSKAKLERVFPWDLLDLRCSIISEILPIAIYLQKHAKTMSTYLYTRINDHKSI